MAKKQARVFFIVTDKQTGQPQGTFSQIQHAIYIARAMEQRGRPALVTDNFYRIAYDSDSNNQGDAGNMMKRFWL